MPSTNTGELISDVLEEECIICDIPNHYDFFQNVMS